MVSVDYGCSNVQVGVLATSPLSPDTNRKIPLESLAGTGSTFFFLPSIHHRCTRHLRHALVSAYLATAEIIVIMRPIHASNVIRRARAS